MTKVSTVGVITLAAAVSLTAIHAVKVRAEQTSPHAHHVTSHTHITLPSDKPDFAAMGDVKQKKTAFFAYLQPMIDRENSTIAHNRGLLEHYFTQHPAPSHGGNAPTEFLENIASQYQLPIPTAGVNAAWQQAILARVDQIPAALVMSQAAIESAWGTSRFAVEANNYFGQWCYTQGCGLFPHQEKGGHFHEVQRFANTQAAVDAYFTNVNTNPAYQALRDIRAEQRAAGTPITSDAAANAMAQGLIHYSQIGEKYVQEIRAMIHDDRQYMPPVNAA
ncbi:glucosaminidase domain-containing protein [Photobacterium aphoticum]|uniref:glucosaminidase domain-containing protein n=1 Tax=Photobacterium aphoticum TaxID=754436 RepID=UPI00069F4B4A|nr:glucosaminidase domain-containing protein [Photobacterium aphoticum]PSU55934.1 glucosaminidase [Photobacterium aphoticum]GHA38261.1 glucosaminidase [Photobacterium aphoticum]